MNKKIDHHRLLIAGILISIGVFCRILLHDFFNSLNNPFTTNGFLDVFFVIATISIFSGLLLGKYYTLIVPLFVIAITDIYYAIIDPLNAALWTSWLFLFTGTGYIFISLIGQYTNRNEKLKLKILPKLLGAGIFGIIIYDLWTNFGFWLSYSKLGFYPPTIGGLISVYIGGLPFMLWHLISTSIAITIVVIPLIYFKEFEMPSSNQFLKPAEKIVIISSTVILVISSIITAII